MAKKLIAFFMAAVLIILTLSGCTQASTEEKQTTQPVTERLTDNTSFKLSYTQSDSLDPFKAKAQNNQVLATLVFESLFDIDSSYELVNNIATEYEYTDKRELKVKYNPQITFSDGSTLDSEDIIYSFEAAKESPAYGNSLKYISYAESLGNSTIAFYLSNDNPYAVNLLTFPITSINDDENGFPIGSGRYRYAEEGGKTVLKANESKSFTPYITTINLVNIAAADSIDNAINIGNISYAFRDLSSSVAKRISSAKKLVSMNNLVYVGINSFGGITANAQIRKAISLAADRSTIAGSAYSGYADIANSMFHPKSKIAENVKIFSNEADTATAKQAILQSNIEAKKLKLKILVNKNNNRAAAATLLKSQLEAVGFSVEVEIEETKEYTRRAKNHEFDLYIGEVKLSDDMCLYPFFSKKGGVRYGIDNKSITCDELYSDYLAGETELGKFILAFNEEMPFVPLIYKKGMICYTKAMNGDMQGYYGNFFSNIESWHFDA